MVFRVCQLNYDCQIWLRQTSVVMVMKVCDSQHKIGCYLACAGDMPQMLACSKGFSGSASSVVSIKLCSVDPLTLLLRSREFGIFNVKFAITSVVYKTCNFGFCCMVFGSAGLRWVLLMLQH